MGCGFCRDCVPAINEDRLSVLYSDNPASRPDTPVNVIVGALMLKGNNNLNDDELLAAICCDVRCQYALHTTSCPEQPVSDRTFSRFRERLYNYEVKTGENLLEDEMISLAETYSKYMNLNSNTKRMDSLGSDELLTSDLLHYKAMTITTRPYITAKAMT